MDAIIKFLAAILGIVLLLPIAIALVGLIVITLIGGYVGMVITMWDWVLIILILPIALWGIKKLVNFILDIIERFRG